MAAIRPTGPALPPFSSGTPPWREATDRAGRLREPWTALSSLLEGGTPDERAELSAAAARQLEDLGATYNVYADAGGAGRPWRTDPLPLMIGATEWRRVADGLEQRLLLLETVLGDLYGPQRLLREGLVPPDLVHANPHFLPALRGTPPAGGRHLLAAGFDLVRDSAGFWRIARDHTRVPGGLGQALENRSVTVNLLPAEFERSGVARILPFFDLEQEALRGLSASRGDGIGAVLLTPGFRHPSYFEHAYMARTLGIPLVEPADLTVRERRLFLKTLAGLRRVDVVACRLDDDAIDPLEFRTHGGGGVPGLAEAWRSGNVALANAPGSGFAGTLALLPFLPGICRAWLGEELKLPFVETWWLGQPDILRRVLLHPDEHLLFPAFREGQEAPIRFSTLGAEERQQWISKVRARPHDYVVQRDLAPSLAPSLEGRSLTERPVVWRAFCLCSAQGPVTLPGGLGLVAPDGIASLAGPEGEQVVKDVWVTGEVSLPVVSRSAASPEAPARIQSGADVPSRVAEQLYWVGRYAERLETATRLLRAAVRRLTGEKSSAKRAQLDACLVMLPRLRLDTGGLSSASDPLPQLAGLVHDPASAAGLHPLIQPLLWNAASTRDRLSDDTWRLFNRLEGILQGGATPTASQLLHTLDTLVLHLAAFAGMQAENMTRGQGWRFLEIGRRIERALSVLSLLAAAPEPGLPDAPALDCLLETCDSTMTYRRRHLARPRWDAVLGLLFSDSANPRSVAAQAAILAGECGRLPGDPAAGVLPALRGQVSAMEQAVLPSPQLPDMSTFAELTAGFLGISDLLTQQYFSHSVRRVY